MFVAKEPDAQAWYSSDPHLSSLCSQKPVTYISFCCPAQVGFSQDWATFYTFFTLQLPEEEWETKRSLCLFQGLASRRGAMSQFYYEISWGKAQRVWRQQVLAVEAKLAGLCWGLPRRGKRNSEYRELVRQSISVRAHTPWSQWAASAIFADVAAFPFILEYI